VWKEPETIGPSGITAASPREEEGVGSCAEARPRTRLSRALQARECMPSALGLSYDVDVSQQSRLLPRESSSASYVQVLRGLAVCVSCFRRDSELWTLR
jgi:hypothetical protein